MSEKGNGSRLFKRSGQKREGENIVGLIIRGSGGSTLDEFKNKDQENIERIKYQIRNLVLLPN